MKEDFLHYVWNHKKFDFSDLRTTAGESITILHCGHHNHDSGPDFFNSQLIIANQMWAGNVEIHIKSSDWYVHNHETDKAYDNVILHVVFDHDMDIYRADNTLIPTLVLQPLICPKTFANYRKLEQSKMKWINCEADFKNVDDLIISQWLERLYIERLEEKSKRIVSLLESSNNNWEEVLFKLLAKNFGLKVNGDAFFSLSSSFEFAVVRKCRNNPIQLEALFFGQAGLLNSAVENAYFLSLDKEYQFLRQKFNLENRTVIPVQFFRLRPPNFPTIRLSQLAMLYHEHSNLFSRIITSKSLEDLYALFEIGTSPFWFNHYTFQKESKPSTKKLTKGFMDLLLINTVVPLKFCYDRYLGNSQSDANLSLIQQLQAETNGIVSAYNNLKPVAFTAMDSQALLQLKSEYCEKNKCMKCAIGNWILTR